RGWKGQEEGQIGMARRAEDGEGVAPAWTSREVGGHRIDAGRLDEDEREQRADADDGADGEQDLGQDARGVDENIPREAEAHAPAEKRVAHGEQPLWQRNGDEA